MYTMYDDLGDGDSADPGLLLSGGVLPPAHLPDGRGHYLSGSYRITIGCILAEKGYPP
jgi:hypothetical protein